jgi:hypothetical protein
MPPQAFDCGGHHRFPGQAGMRAMIHIPLSGQKKSKAATNAALKRLAPERGAHLAIHQKKSHPPRK